MIDGQAQAKSWEFARKLGLNARRLCVTSHLDDVTSGEPVAGEEATARAVRLPVCL